MADKKIKINRAPVMTLWATVVAERLGYDRPAALTIGKAVAGLNAQAKGRRLGIFGEGEDGEKGRPKEPKPGEVLDVPVLGRRVPAVQTKDGLRATVKGEPISPGSVSDYLAKKFGGDLPAARSAMEALAAAYPPAELEEQAYGLYEKFRPQIPEGTRGWGAKGDLDLGRIRALAKA
ncbi:MAG: hypothetical protein ACRDHL_03810 [Candidatus Promineifilaceae bacterium]